MKYLNRYVLTFEGHKQHRLRMKHRKERKEEGEINQKRIELEKKEKQPPFNPDESFPGYDQC